MGEGITAAVNVKSGSTAVSIYVRGRISPACLATLKTLIKNWAQECGLKVDGVKMKLKPLPKSAAKKKK